MRAHTRDLAAREAKLEELQQQLAQSVIPLVTGEDWKRALEFAARFRSRSFINTMLIYVQHYSAYKEGRVPRADAHVAGFHQWLALGSQVVGGQHGYPSSHLSQLGSRPARQQRTVHGAVWHVARIPATRSCGAN